MSTAALEAAVNEIYLQAVDKTLSAFTRIDAVQVALIAELWQVLENSRAPMLKKHDIALTAIGQSPFRLGVEPVQSAASLIGLRDPLIHFKPEWNDELEGILDWKSNSGANSS